MEVRTDMCDFPTAWEIQRRYPDLEHGQKCSCVPGWHPLSGPGLLCDCNAVYEKWQELKEQQEGKGDE
jgi:hypothetical protein